MTVDPEVNTFILQWAFFPQPQLPPLLWHRLPKLSEVSANLPRLGKIRDSEKDREVLKNKKKKKT